MLFDTLQYNKNSQNVTILSLILKDIIFLVFLNHIGLKEICNETSV